MLLVPAPSSTDLPPPAPRRGLAGARPFGAAPLVAAFVAALTLLAACTDERSDYQHGDIHVVIPPADASGDWDLATLDLPPPLADGVTDGLADGAADTPLADTTDVVLPDGVVPDVVNRDVPLPPRDTNVPPPPARTCGATFTYAGTATSVHVAGPFNEWSATADPLRQEGGAWTTTIDVAPGNYPYKLVVEPPPAGGDNPWILDPGNPRIAWDGAGDCCWNSKVEVPDCSVPLLELESLDRNAAAGTIDAVILVRDGGDASAGSGGIDADSVEVTLDAGAGDAGLAWEYDRNAQRIYVAVRNASVPNKVALRASAANANGTSAPLWLPVWLEEKPFRWDDAVLYFLFVDRFANGDPTNDGGAACDQAVWDMGDWMGGDWKGAREKIEAGWFDELGVNALWITAPQDNPDGCSAGSIAGKLYSSYHGYHPKSQREPENHFGTMADFQALVDAAHARGIRVLTDAVVNHVHEEHPWATAHPDWFNQPYVRCGSNDCGGSCWDNAPITCWFEPNLPDLDFKKDAAVEAVTDDLVWWVHETNLDGFRVDAVKHVEDSLVYELRAEIGERIETTGDVFYTVGETFAGGDDAGIALLRRYIGPDLLHGQFDFPLFWELRGAFADGSVAMDTLAAKLQSLQDAYGPTALMSNFLGNHDVVRFLSAARGDADDATSPPERPLPGDPGLEDLYGKAQVAFGFLMTIPGIPLLYYGDEVGLVGVGDPDNRRRMVFDEASFGAPQQQSALLAQVRALGQARKASVALRRGDLAILATTGGHLAFARRADGEAAVVALNRDAFSPWEAVLNVASSGWGDGTTVRDVLSDRTYTVADGAVTVTVPVSSEGGAAVLLAE